ncbi:hypothetical protein SELMODRAFT_443493 [Selaginella moellendorffii]|uniref:BAHD family acyltransferase, clade V n=2 Tax=Selaginella moellendorffii TaxID=88036 RepID=D8S2P3_SELML|nr:hypothetical protein SELMODRAFT_443493 [Selaginella moellendorffii]
MASQLWCLQLIAKQIHRPVPAMLKQQHHHQVTIHGVKTVVSIHPSQLAIHPVSKLDSILGNFYLHTVIYFDKVPTSSPWEVEREELNFSLAEVLDLFPSVSGRLRVLDNGNLGIKSNDAGIRVVEATCDSSLREWLEAEKDGSNRQQLLPEVRISDYSVSPLLAIQYTLFRGGGLALGLSWCHILADFMSMDLLVKLWGEAHRKQGKLSSRPTSSVDVTSADVQLPQPFAHTNLSIKASELDTRVFHFGSKVVEAITRESGGGGGETEALCAAVWKAVVKAQEQPSSGNSRLCLWSNTNLERNRGYFGNSATAFKFVDAVSPLGQSSVSDVAKAIQLGTRTNGSYKCASSFFANNVLFCNWAANVPVYDDADFGFSKPFYVEFLAAPLFGEGMVTIAPGREGGRSKSVCVSLQSEAMKRLLQESYFGSSSTKPANGVIS